MFRSGSAQDGIKRKKGEEFTVLGEFATDTYRMGFVLHPGHAFEIVNRLERGSDGI